MTLRIWYIDGELKGRLDDNLVMAFSPITFYSSDLAPVTPGSLIKAHCTVEVVDYDELTATPSEIERWTFEDSAVYLMAVSLSREFTDLVEVRCRGNITRKRARTE